MNKTYPILHWVFTLLIAPLTSLAILYIWVANPHQLVGLVEVYPVTLQFSALFWLPILIIYLHLIPSSRNLLQIPSELYQTAGSELPFFCTSPVHYYACRPDLFIGTGQNS